MKLFLLLIGMVMVLEGLPYAAAPDRMQSWLKKLAEMRPQELRLFGLVTVAAGLTLCWLVRGAGGL